MAENEPDREYSGFGSDPEQSEVIPVKPLDSDPVEEMLFDFRENISSDLKKAFHFAHIVNPRGGTCLEFGVFKGRTFVWQLGEALRFYPHTKLIGFDSWAGLPKETDGVWCPDRHQPGLLSCPQSVPQGYIDLLTQGKHENRYALVHGFFSESLTPNLRSQINNLIFVNIDVDLHSSTVEVLRFIEPLLRVGTVIYFDDWKDPQDQFDGTWGEHLAWHEFQFHFPHIQTKVITVNELNQHVMLVTGIRKIHLPERTIQAFVDTYTMVGHWLGDYEFNIRRARREREEALAAYEKYINPTKNGETCSEC